MKKLAIFVLLLSIIGSVDAQNQNISNGNVFDGEPYLAINPANPQHLVVAWMGWINLANQFKIKVKTSFDGGNTWSTAVELPHTVSTYSSADPCIAFNNAGEVFVSYIDFTGTTPPVVGGVYLCKSTDGGLSFGAPKLVISSSFDGTKWPIDRPWMVIDKSSGSSAGTIYITSFNLNRTNPPYNPYLSVSVDTGNSFTTRYLDTANFLAGSLNNLPVASPTISSNGTLYASYPSYVPTQSLYVQSLMASSNNQGNSLTHNVLHTVNPPANIGNYPNAKKAALLLSNPADANHLAYIYLNTTHGDIDVFMKESINAGSSWSVPVRVNDDPIGNDRMQEMLWGDFDKDGDLVVSWRDRRNGTDSTFETQTEIWAAFRSKDSSSFSSNFQLTSQSIVYDSILEKSGNDFMCIKLQDDTINATWGDTRTGKLNIWFQRMTTNGQLLSTKNIASDELSSLELFPNPTHGIVTVKGKDIRSVSIYTIQGKLIESYQLSTIQSTSIDLTNLSRGTYIIQLETKFGIEIGKVVKE